MTDFMDVYRTREWFKSLEWQHRWIDFMAGWWAGTYGRPKHMIDYGAGDGWWSYAFKKMGSDKCEAFAVELDEVAHEFIPSGVEFLQHDLRQPLDVPYKFDLVICLEVAEHMSKNAAHNALLATLAKSTGNLLMFSAAQPGQPGTGHINLQPQSYWIDAIQKWPYIQFSNIRTAAARKAFENILPEGLAFLPRNLLIFARV
jgi:SAM-dependent methyltransferase